ncbi:hypothetical protein GQ44DRAFT_765347 [Phaeosphaeriaceae sp. PMI808]|nr:hypothetical protein GQ44DRAFT_765347 [Phaeosphaeriaceae sp. PMI808]
MTTDAVSSHVSTCTVLNSSFPVFLPKSNAIFMTEADFQALIKRELTEPVSHIPEEPKVEIGVKDTMITPKLGSSNLKRAATSEADNDRPQKASFIAGLERIMLEDAWAEDPLLTLKIIFNARSIHLCKSNKVAAYKVLGWLSEAHPLTLLANLCWIVRPVIAKKAPRPQDKTEEGHVRMGDIEDFDMVDVDEIDPIKAHNVRNGLSHGYWKGLLNLVAFAANEQLKFDVNPASLLNQHTEKSIEGKRKRNWDPVAAKKLRHQQKERQNKRVQEKIKHDPFYRALHYTVARLFAQQLKEDKALLDSGKKSDLRNLSLAAKWAPTFGEFHDKHTFKQPTIAEILFPEPALCCSDDTTRELHLRHIRENYRKQYTSPLRKALGVVERDIAATTFESIKYERVPTLAMDRYTGLFLKDYEHFKQYIDQVAKGDAKIAGATLMPSTLISKARSAAFYQPSVNRNKDFKALKAAATLAIQNEVIDGQWKTLVQRVRDSGTLQSSIAICDPALWWGFISFHDRPAYVSVVGNSDTRGLVDKLRYIMQIPWGYSTNFVSVFEDVILPMAISNNLKQEDMVKQVFVFSDMQFDCAEQGSCSQWTSSFERIQKRYAEAGYKMPRLIFWNLAGQSTDKPVTMDDVNTALVLGYSQGMLRAFMESGALDEREEEDEDIVEISIEDEGEDGMTEVKKVKKKMDAMTVVRKAVGHQSYSMLEVLD